LSQPGSPSTFLCNVVAEFGTPDNNYDDVLTAVFVGERLPNPTADLLDFDGVVTGGRGKSHTHTHTHTHTRTHTEKVYFGLTRGSVSFFSFFAFRSLYLHNRKVPRSLWHVESPTSCT
jgi:hypothetical protein